MIRISLPGRAATKGSITLGVANSGKPYMRQANRSEKGWRDAVSMLALQARGSQPILDCPVVVEITCHYPRPASHLTKAGLAKPGTPHKPTAKPDLDKVARSILDALTGIIFTDDSRVTTLIVSKRFSLSAFVEITIAED